jgi:hypothetical protein
MYLSPRTIDGYRDALFEKLNVRTRVGLAMYAVRSGIVRIELVEHTLLFHYLDAFLVLDLTPAAGYIPEVVDALAFEQGGCYDAAIAAAAMYIEVMSFFRMAMLPGSTSSCKGN